jgi:hypothetical protein
MDTSVIVSGGRDGVNTPFDLESFGGGFVGKAAEIPSRLRRHNVTKYGIVSFVPSVPAK